MTSQIPRIASTVLYTLTAQDAAAINKRRKDALNRNAAGVTLASQELGAQIHQGNQVSAGDVYPLVITRVWGDRPDSGVNGQLLLDGNDTLWVSSVSAGAGERHFTYLQESAEPTANPQEPGVVVGYKTQQAQSAIDMVNTSKGFENDLGDWIAQMRASDAPLDPRWVAIAVTGFQQAFMALNRAVFQPESRLR